MRTIEEFDAEVTYKMRSDPEKSRYIHRAEGTVEDQRKYIAQQQNKPDDYLFVIEDKSGNAIGMRGVL